MKGPLSGIKVIEAANFVSGPYAAQLLADLGAEVIKIENPKGGDPFRSEGYATPFVAFNSNKKSVTIDIRTDAGSHLFKSLATDADVIVENFRPGVLDKYGIGCDVLRTINPRLIYCAISGFGQHGPYRRRPAYDTVASALSGMLGLMLKGDHPQILGPAISDGIAGLYASYGILGALVRRQQTGLGGRVDVSMVESTVAFLRDQFAVLFATGHPPGPLDRPAASLCFALRCSDEKLLSIHLSWPEKFWIKLTDAIGRSDLRMDVRFSTRKMRIANYLALEAELRGAFLTQPRKTWMDILEHSDVPFAPVNQLDETLSDPHVQQLELFADCNHPEFGKVRVLRPPVRYDHRKESDMTPPPALGEHTDEVLAALGVSQSERSALRSQGAIG